MTKKDKEKLNNLVNNGVIGADLQAMITRKAKKGTGAIAGAVLFATLQANKNAKKTKIPLLIEENNALYELSPDGSKRKIKDMPKSSKKIPYKFKVQ